MKNFSKLIITLICFFSIANNTFASEWYIEQLLDLNYWIEEYDLELANLDYIYFTDEITNEMFTEFRKINELLKWEIISKYRSNEFDFYKTNGIISSHKKFVYYTNRLFYYISLKEQRQDYKELDDAILKTYKNVRIYYRKVKNLAYRK